MEAEGCSYLMERPFVYKWYVKDIKSIIEFAKNSSPKEISTESPEFSANSKIKDSWCLRLKISNPMYQSAMYMGISLIPKNGDKKEVRAKYGIYILNNERKKFCRFDNQFKEQYLSPQIKIFCASPSDSISIHANLLLEKANEFLHNGTLTIGVDLTVYDFVGINNPINLLKDSGRTICDDFKRLLVTKEKSDIVIKVGNKKFDAHKFILTVRSSVFDAMFSHDMKESKRNEVTIPDVDPEVFKKLLEFIYTDKVDDLKNFAEELLEASDRYQLQGLKEKCEEFLAQTLAVENVLRVVVLAERHNAKRLKEVAITYVVIHYADVKITKNYKTFEKSHPSLFIELLRTYVEKINIK